MLLFGKLTLTEEQNDTLFTAVHDYIKQIEIFSRNYLFLISHNIS